MQSSAILIWAMIPASSGQIDAQTPIPRVYAIAPSEPSPESITEPSMVMQCDVADEHRHWFPLTYLRKGAQGGYIVSSSGRRSVGRSNPSYSIASPDRRFAGWKQVANLHNVQGVAFDGPGLARAVVRVDESLTQRMRKGVITIYVSEEDEKPRLSLYSGFCSARIEPQAPAPDEVRR